jgi:hypothetical protein
MAFLCVSQPRGVQKHHKKFFGGVHVKNLLPEKKTTFSLSFFPLDFFNRVFGRFAACGALGAQKHHKPKKVFSII